MIISNTHILVSKIKCCTVSYLLFRIQSSQTILFYATFKKEKKRKNSPKTLFVIFRHISAIAQISLMFSLFIIL